MQSKAYMSQINQESQCLALAAAAADETSARVYGHPLSRQHPAAQSPVTVSELRPMSHLRFYRAMKSRARQNRAIKSQV